MTKPWHFTITFCQSVPLTLPMALNSSYTKITSIRFWESANSFLPQPWQIQGLLGMGLKRRCSRRSSPPCAGGCCVSRWPRTFVAAILNNEGAGLRETHMLQMAEQKARRSLPWGCCAFARTISGDALPCGSVLHDLRHFLIVYAFSCGLVCQEVKVFWGLIK